MDIYGSWVLSGMIHSWPDKVGRFKGWEAVGCLSILQFPSQLPLIECSLSARTCAKSFRIVSSWPSHDTSQVIFIFCRRTPKVKMINLLTY